MLGATFKLQRRPQKSDAAVAVVVAAPPPSACSCSCSFSCLSFIFLLHFSPLIFNCAIKMRPGQKRQRQFRIARGGKQRLYVDPVPATTPLPLPLPACPKFTPADCFCWLLINASLRIHTQKMRQNNEKCLKIAMLVAVYALYPPSLLSSPPGSLPCSLRMARQAAVALAPI